MFEPHAELGERSNQVVLCASTGSGLPSVSIHSLNPTEAWLASQKGLLAEAPHRQSVTRLRTS